ncbi:hypothetical protein [Streptomyces sp. CC224B]|uniref:hypothetical protein n=1 Tax=Streptomyces sp. CC224B TaxID=3044571 RepID=UPI0024A8C481|nr:hypothetical protein [Streptomyces sp. CC224B]
MALVALCSLKGSPGVTTTALGLAAGWPAGDAPVVVECDPAGGDLLARFRLDLSPGLVSLAAAARRATDPDLLWQHTQRLPGGLRVVVGPPGAEQARAALEQLTHDGGTTVRSWTDVAGAVVLADCGRVEGNTQVMPVLRTADLVLLLARARSDALAYVAMKREALGQWSRALAFVLVGEGYRDDEVSRELGIEVAARLPADLRGAALLRGVTGRRAAPARTELGKALASLATRMAGRVVKGSERTGVEVTDTELTAPALHFRLPGAQGWPECPASSGNGGVR